MIEKISNKIYSFLTLKQLVTEEKKEIILFGITRVIEDIPKFIGIIVVGIISNTIKEMLVVTIVTLLYKTFTGGVHAKTNIMCFVCSLFVMLFSIYTAKLLYISNLNLTYITTLIYIFSLYTIFIYVPADVIEIPKINKEIRRRLKLGSIIMLNILTIFSIWIIKDSYISYLIISSILYISMMTTRTIYNLFRTNYGFETYIKNVT